MLEYFGLVQPNNHYPPGSDILPGAQGAYAAPQVSRNSPGRMIQRSQVHLPVALSC